MLTPQFYPGSPLRTIGDMRRILLLAFFICIASVEVLAAESAFDLQGPKLDVHVKRGSFTLPIGEVPNLLPGDRLWIHPDLPESQSMHFVLIVAFLRGATNPPPVEWFTRVETWNSNIREEGVFVTVPEEAQQALIFLAPETGGDFSTLRKTVRDRPGSFVRSVQDLQAASYDRMRLDVYLQEVKESSQTDPESLKQHAALAARSLGIRLDQQCFDKPSDQQAPCLVQHTEGMVLDDANAQSRVAQITAGSTSDLMTQISSSSLMGSGQFSPYVGAVVDTARILASLHTAHFQYIPALALSTRDTLNLRLNMPPSFRDPKSVVVVALPPVGAVKQPPLHPVNQSERFCVERPGLVLPVEGAPMVFGSQLLYDLKLRIETRTGPIELPVRADPSEGGLVLIHPAPALPEGELTAVLRGKWGFEDWEGPRFHVRSAHLGKWTVASGEQSALVVGRDDVLHIEGDSSLCVDRVDELNAIGGPLKLNWSSPKPEELEVTVPLKEAAPGPVNLGIYQFGLAKPDQISLNAYAEAASLDRLTLSAGDADAVLKGNRLDEVAKVDLAVRTGTIAWTPATLSRVQDSDQLTLKTENPTSALEPGKRYSATVQLLDGRSLRVPVTVDPPRPQVSLLNKGTQEDTSAPPSPVQLGSPDDLPIDRRLVFFLKSQVPATFPRHQKVEVAAADGSFFTMLDLADGSLMLEDAKTAMGVIEPLTRFGTSAFGPLRVRAISPDGLRGDWIPLGVLVRLPAFKELRCPRAVSKPCTLSGTNLFLVTSIAATAEFENPVDVPSDFAGNQLSVPHPTSGVLFFKLRDDPATVQTLTLPVTPAAGANATALKSQPAAATPPPRAVKAEK